MSEESTTPTPAATPTRTRTTAATFEPLLTAPAPADFSACNARIQDLGVGINFVEREIAAMKTAISEKEEFRDKLQAKSDETFDLAIEYRNAAKKGK